MLGTRQLFLPGLLRALGPAAPVCSVLLALTACLAGRAAMTASTPAWLPTRYTPFIKDTQALPLSLSEFIIVLSPAFATLEL